MPEWLNHLVEKEICSPCEPWDYLRGIESARFAAKFTLTCMVSLPKQKPRTRLGLWWAKRKALRILRSDQQLDHGGSNYLRGYRDFFLLLSEGIAHLK